MSDYRVHAGEAQEDQFTAAIEKYTAPIPSSVYLGLAVGSIIASITIQAVQKERPTLPSTSASGSLRSSCSASTTRWSSSTVPTQRSSSSSRKTYATPAGATTPTGVNVCCPSSATLTSPVPIL